jgi:endonuclease/exonuclease/phosphatase family metal-dependent hydrolase
MPLPLLASPRCLHPSRRLFFAVSLTLLLAIVPGRAEETRLTVMTYNLRFATETPPNAWSARRPLLCEVIRRAAPDVIGTQEGLYGQLQDMAEDLPGYTWIGLGREGGSRGEFAAVFYRTDRLLPVAYDHFWLSETPQVIGSATWGNRYVRMVTWVRFRDRKTGAEFYFWNTHFDHEVVVAREKSAGLLKRRIEAVCGGTPVLVVGDFNAPAQQSAPYSILTDGEFLLDAWIKAPRRQGEGLGTFNGFGKTPDGRERIDWILFRGGWQAESAAITTDKKGDQYPNDHYPVTAVLRLP